MTAPQKAVLSLFITALLFGGFAALAFTGLFDVIETRFYNPAVTASVTNEVVQSAGTIDEFFTTAKVHFSQILAEPAVQRSFLLHQSADDIFERSRIFGLLHDSVGRLQWVRFIDSDGARVHFSTYSLDIIAQGPLFITYRNFNEPDFPYHLVAAEDGAQPRLIMDAAGDRIFLSFPFYDSFEIFRGTALFSLSARALSDLLISEGRLATGHDISVVSNPPGFLSGAPASFAEEALLTQISSIWSDTAPPSARLYSPETGISLTLLSVTSPHGFFVGRLVNDDIFLFPLVFRIVLLLTFFFTLYLMVFLLFNLRQNPTVVVQNRMKKLQISLIEQYYERESNMDWGRWSRELEQRRGEINAQLKRGIKIASGSKAADIDAIIDKSWDELLPIIGGSTEATIDEGKLQIILNRFFASPQGVPTLGAPPHAVSPALVDTAKVVQDAELAGEAEELEELEELEEIEATAEAVEVIEELEELEELEEIEAASEAEEVVEELEALEIAEEAETLDISAISIERVASDLEFDDTIAPISPEDTETMESKEYAWDGFEVVSPFSETLPVFGGEEAEELTSEDEVIQELFEGVLEELSENSSTDSDAPGSPADELSPLGYPLLSASLFSIRGADIETLQALPDEDAEQDEISGIIEDREGVPYINENVLKTSRGTEPGLNQSFKNLVDSVMK